MGDYLRVSTVQVVQAIDLAELDKTIKWLVSKVQELPTADQANQRTIADSLLQDQIDALRRENSSLKDALAQLQSKQDDMESRLDTKQDRDQATPDGTEADAGANDVPAGGSKADLESRLAALEQRVEQLPTTSAHDEAEHAEASSPGPDLNSQFQELLAGHRALAATVSGLQHELESKPNRAELDLKANRSELDALLRAGVSMATVGDAVPPALSVQADGSVDNAALVEAVNKAAAEAAAMRGQVAVMQDRLQGKSYVPTQIKILQAEQGGVDELAAQLAALKARGLPSGRKAGSAGGADASASPGLGGSGAVAAVDAADGISSVPSVAVPSTLLDTLSKRLDELEVRVSAGPSNTPVSVGSSDHAVDAIDSLHDVQPLLKDIYKRVDSKADSSGIVDMNLGPFDIRPNGRAALEEVLRRLQEVAASVDQKADSAALRDSTTRLEKLISTSLDDKPGSAQQRKMQQQASTPQELPWVVSHELVDGSGPGSAAFEQLRAQVTELAARVAQLPESWPEAGLPPGRKSSMGLEGLDLTSVQGALAALHGQLGELGTRLAGKADAGEVARLELALNSKADLDELAEIRLALGSKADAATLGDLQIALAGKADQAALDEVKLTAALAADMAAGANGDISANGNGNTTGGGGYTNLLGAIQGMVADKANKAELSVLQNLLASKASAEDVGLLRAALEDKASAAELTALMAQFSGRPANSEEIASLDQRMGDVFAELAKIRADMAALPVDMLTGAAAAHGAAAARDGGDTAALQRIVTALTREVGTLREGLDTVAHAANVLAVGLDGGVRFSATGAATGGVEGRYSEAGGAGGKENRSPRGGYERLLKLLGSGDYRHKMEAFDPVALQQMAQKLAYLEATVKSPAMGRAGLAGVDYGIKELERQVKRLNTDVRLMKDKLIEPPPALALAGSRLVAPGDHAMLAARPITGYRCMACDRPLDQLDVSPGPHVPTQQLPVRVPAATDTVSRSQVRSGRGDPLSPQASAQRLAYANDPNARNGQNWYKDAPPVVAAEALPRDYVGPHLPPGGWRPSNPGSAVKQPSMQGSLPALSAPKTRPPQAGMDYDPKGQPAAAVPMEGVPANVTLPQIS
ncbi:hypothetical protein VOLCADRAFT_106223 [Volvox carteri f. nagariensis]|uniref:Flagellar associated protein n=1 Tax=Volvox carteri f. nagariensis TaxID=3068 RepID=D8U5X9_VOLCA|nr:uncharacterized protein VOLCADRAFT_106223 [Volvox carteri f. nagariensis]EFJ44837.1 hypothetical protein VOLCADRAFT_106223 [Volvox carteri f. nagariensis]|eukprot:XP_002954120.1 hypothetical protein VOLCADRAFT_106223 [Volvox carteri f. nagariensis]